MIIQFDWGHYKNEAPTDLAYIHQVLRNFPQFREVRVQIEADAAGPRMKNNNTALDLGDHTTVHDYLPLAKLAATTRIETVLHNVDGDMWFFEWQRKSKTPGTVLAPMRGEDLEWYGFTGTGDFQATQEELAVVENMLKEFIEGAKDVSN